MKNRETPDLILQLAQSDTWGVGAGTVGVQLSKVFFLLRVSFRRQRLKLLCAAPHKLYTFRRISGICP